MNRSLNTLGNNAHHVSLTTRRISGSGRVPDAWLARSSEFLPERFRRDYQDTLVRAERKQIFVAADNRVGLACNRARDDHVVLKVEHDAGERSRVTSAMRRRPRQ